MRRNGPLGGRARRRGRRAARQERRAERQEQAHEQDAAGAPPQAAGMPFAVPPAVETMLRKRAEAAAEGPETFLHGTVNGAGMIVASALAGAAVVVSLPLMGLARGGLGGLVAGSVAGGLAGAAIPVAGVLAGTGQIVKGVFNTPSTVAAFVKSAAASRGGPEEQDLDDLESEIRLDEEDEAHARAEVNEALFGRGDESWPAEVRDASLYEALGAAPTATSGDLLAAYLAAYEAAAGDEEAARRVSSAYQALRDPERRAAYNEKGAAEGLAGFIALEHGAYHDMVAGEVAFTPYVGVLAAALPPAKSAADRDAAQKRREHDVAHALRERIAPFCAGRHEDFVRQQLEAAEGLRGTRYGRQMLTLLGHTYKAKAALVLGHRGVLSWISGGWHDAREAIGDAKDCAEAVQAAAALAEMRARLDRGAVPEADQHLTRAQVELQERTVNAAWTVTVLDVEATVRAAVTAVLERASLPRDEFRKRAEAILLLGRIFLYAGGDRFDADAAAKALAD